jgi:hypothetical protein
VSSRALSFAIPLLLFCYICRCRRERNRTGCLCDRSRIPPRRLGLVHTCHAFYPFRLPPSMVIVFACVAAYVHGDHAVWLLIPSSFLLSFALLISRGDVHRMRGLLHRLLHTHPPFPSLSPSFRSGLCLAFTCIDLYVHVR